MTENTGDLEHLLRKPGAPVPFTEEAFWGIIQWKLRL